MFVLDLFQIGIFLIVGKRNAQEFRLIDDVVNQSAASDLDVIRMRAEEEDSFAEEVHDVHVGAGFPRPGGKTPPLR